MNWFDRMAGGMESSRRIVANFGKLVFVMAKGAYLLEERRKLYEELGTKCFERFARKELSAPELSEIIQHIEKLTKKIEIEEILIRQFRFGYRPRRAHRRSEPTAETVTESSVSPPS